MTTSAGTESYVFDALNRISSATYTNADLVEYTYDPDGNRLTKKLNSVTTNTYTYDNADQLTSDGSTSYTYDANGNLTGAGSNTYVWDYANRMTGATIAGTTSAYTYAGDDARAKKTVGGTTTNYLWDRTASNALLVDDGTNAYLHSNGPLGQVNSTNQATYHLDDGLNSVRGLTDGTGTLTGSADYDVFGAIRASSGGSSIFGFTGQQFDSETGNTFLRARYLNPSLGRFTSADGVQPNAPGTQGYNVYTYVANNPTTWTDPTGHYAAGDAAITAQVMANPYLIISLVGACAVAAGAGGYTAATTTGDVVRLNPGAGLVFGACLTGLITIRVTIPVIVCVLNFECRQQAWEDAKIITANGSGAAGGAWGWGKGKVGECCPVPPFPIDFPHVHPPDIPWPFDGDTTAPDTTTSDKGGNSSTADPGDGGGGIDPCLQISFFTQILTSMMNMVGDISLGRASESVANELGREWVGEGYTVSSEGTALVSENGSKVYRFPEAKVNRGVTQANFEFRLKQGGAPYTERPPRHRFKLPMRGRLYELDSPDVPGMDLESYRPADPTDILIQVAARIGSDSQTGTNMFYFGLRTPRALERELRENTLLFGRGYILVPEYNYRTVYEAISNLCASIEAPDWDAFAAKLRQYAFWEYD